MDYKYIIIGVLVVIIIALCAVIVMPHNETANDDSNITLIKADTEGYASVTDGKEYYHYYLTGVLQNLPENLDGYDVKTRFYGSDGKYLDDDGDMYDIARSSANSQKTTLGAVTPNEDYHMEKVVISVIDPNGKIVFNDTIKFDMNKFDYSDLNGESSDDSNSAHYSVEGQVDGKSYSYDVDMDTK